MPRNFSKGPVPDRDFAGNARKILFPIFQRKAFVRHLAGRKFPNIRKNALFFFQLFHPFYLLPLKKITFGYIVYIGQSVHFDLRLHI